MARHNGKPFSRSRLVSGRAWPDLSSSWGRPAPAPVMARPMGTPAAAAALDRIRAPACWSPADGDADLPGRPGRDTLRLPAIGLAQLLAVLDLDDPRLSLHLDADGAIRFIGPEGEPVRFSGALTLDGATLRFTGMACLLLG
ncbi:hypothetical protein [Falsiroseomonas sp. E2-1-a20]|uniref:hypothetical protein n=1 Tax=Falsiroseomonas sp. E2-1-a20 TaxID=3239300 RepID=UPI003F395800